MLDDIRPEHPGPQSVDRQPLILRDGREPGSRPVTRLGSVIRTLHP
jgi:hypothetical protein